MLGLLLGKPSGGAGAGLPLELNETLARFVELRLQCHDAGRCIQRGAAQLPGHRVQRVQALTLPVVGRGGRQRLDPSQPGADAALGHNLESADEPGGGTVRTPAELLAEAVVHVGIGVADRHDAHVGLVLLAEDRRRPVVDRVLVAHLVRGDRNVVTNARADQRLGGGKLFGARRLGLGVVEA